MALDVDLMSYFHNISKSWLRIWLFYLNSNILTWTVFKYVLVFILSILFISTRLGQIFKTPLCTLPTAPQLHPPERPYRWISSVNNIRSFMKGGFTAGLLHYTALVWARWWWSFILFFLYNTCQKCIEEGVCQSWFWFLRLSGRPVKLQHLMLLLVNPQWWPKHSDISAVTLLCVCSIRSIGNLW